MNKIETGATHPTAGRSPSFVSLMSRLNERHLLPHLVGDDPPVVPTSPQVVDLRLQLLDDRAVRLAQVVLDARQNEVVELLRQTIRLNRQATSTAASSSSFL